MPENTRKNGNRKAKHLLNKEAEISQVANGLSKSILLLVDQKECFEIKSNGQTSFLPLIENDIELPNDYQIISLQYNIPQEERVDLVLIFKDPRKNSKSRQLFILLN